MERKLTDGERMLIASALGRQASKLENDVTALLSGQPKLEGIDDREREDLTRWDEKFASATLARAKALRREAGRLINLADFISNPKHTVVVDCLLLIPEQA